MVREGGEETSGERLGGGWAREGGRWEEEDVAEFRSPPRSSPPQILSEQDIFIWASGTRDSPLSFPVEERTASS